MSFEWFVARRYLTARRRQAFVSLISAVSILGVGVGVMALIIALALMTGMQDELQRRIVGTAAHVYVYKIDGPFGDVDQERAKWNLPGVVGAAPAIMGQALLTVAGRPAFVQFKGIDVAREPDVTDISQSMLSGSIIALLDRPEGAKDGVVLGADLAATLGVATGDVVWAVTPLMTLTPYGRVPRQRPLEVVGTFRYGFYELDTQQALVSMKTAEELVQPDGPDLIQLKLADMNQAPNIRNQLRQQLGPGYTVSDWTELNASLYSALWLEKIAISATIGLITMVAALNIVASLVLLVMEKSRDIAILRTMGARARTIRRIFVYQGLAIGLIGTVGGAILGLTASYLLDHYRVIRLPADVYQITYLPFRIQAMDVVLVVVSAIGVCLIATVYPSRQAARIDPAEALRNQ